MDRVFYDLHQIPEKSGCEFKTSRYISDYLKKYDDVQTALVCYNMGEGAIQKGIYSTKYSRGVLADKKLLVELEN